MIRVTIEMVPGGDSSKAYTLHKGVIANDTTGTTTMGNYDFVLSKRGGPGTYKSGRVEGFARKQEGAWKLLYLVLKEAFEGES